MSNKNKEPESREPLCSMCQHPMDKHEPKGYGGCSVQITDGMGNVDYCPCNSAGNSVRMPAAPTVVERGKPEAQNVAREFLWRELGTLDVAIRQWHESIGTVATWETLSRGIESRLVKALEAYARAVEPSAPLYREITPSNMADFVDEWEKKNGPCWYRPYSFAKAYRGAVEPSAELRQEWISVDEKLPDFQQQVLVITHSGQIGTANYPFYTDVAYWQKLPERPTQLQGKKENG